MNSNIHGLCPVSREKLTKSLQIWQAARSTSQVYDCIKRTIISFQNGELAAIFFCKSGCLQICHHLDLRDNFTDLLETWHSNNLTPTDDTDVSKILISFKMADWQPLRLQKNRPKSWTSVHHHLDLWDGCSDFLEICFSHYLKTTDNTCAFEILIWFKMADWQPYLIRKLAVHPSVTI